MEKEFNPAEFKEIAIYLKNNGNDISNVSLECINRVIAGRLYYSIFLILRELVTEELSNYRHSEKIDNFIDTLLVGSVHTTLLNFIEKIKDGLNREGELNQPPASPVILLQQPWRKKQNGLYLIYHLHKFVQRQKNHDFQ